MVLNSAELYFLSFVSLSEGMTPAPKRFNYNSTTFKMNEISFDGIFITSIIEYQLVYMDEFRPQKQSTKQYRHAAYVDIR